MQKQMGWVLMIALGVFLGTFAYEKFTEYRVQKALQVELSKFQRQMDGIQADQKRRQLSTEKAKQKRAAELEQQEQARLYRETACAINEDKNHCVCINENTGVRIELAHAECVKRAKEITW